MPDDPTTPPDAELPSRPVVSESAQRRASQTVLDMGRSLGIVLLLIGAVAFITLRPKGPDDGVRVVDYGTDLSSARVAAPYDVLAPEGVDGYRATSVRFTATDDGIVWHLGFVSPLDEYVGLDQTNGALGPFVDDLTEGAAAVGGADATVELGGRTWQRYDEGGDADDERVRGLLADVGDAVALVSGTAGWPELEELAAALSAGDG